MSGSVFNRLVKSNSFFESIYRYYRKWKKRRPFVNLTNEEVFTKIYKSNLWGQGKRMEDDYSGPGSYGFHAENYINLINDFILKHDITSITDIGCGDFAIGHKITSSNPCLEYNGCDVVQYLIEKNQKLFGSKSIQFYHLDATRDILPPADLLTIREVLQHLSNKNIKKILDKTSDYKYIIITEHLFPNVHVKKYNKNKPTGPDIRLIDNSGVYINKPPFNLNCTEILSCRVDAWGKESYLKSFLIIN